jgi:hypothetical protein
MRRLAKNNTLRQSKSMHAIFVFFLITCTIRSLMKIYSRVLLHFLCAVYANTHFKHACNGEFRFDVIRPSAQLGRKNGCTRPMWADGRIFPPNMSDQAGHGFRTSFFVEICPSNRFCFCIGNGVKMHSTLNQSLQ